MGHPAWAFLVEKGRIEFRVTLAHAIEAEVLLGELAGVSAQLLAQSGVGQKFLDGIGKGGFVAGGNQGSALRAEQFRVATDFVGDDGQSSSHRFENDVGQAFGIGSVDGDVEGRENGGHVLTVAEKDRGRAEAEARRFLLQFLAQRAIAYESEFYVWHALTDARGDAEKSRLILVTMIHARDHADAECTGTLGQSGGRGGESLGGQGVSDDCDFLPRKAAGDEAIGGGLRVADHHVAPAKSGGLSAELCRRHQVSKLAMAADDNGHAGKPGGGNQREIGVEVEGVGDLHAMLAQMASEVEASVQRLPSVEAAAEGKFGSVGEVVG